MEQLKIFVLSDGTGETAKSVTKAALTQFNQGDVSDCTIYKNIRKPEQVDAIIKEASIHKALIVHTIVNKEIRDYTIQNSLKEKVRSVDLIGPVLTTFANVIGEQPINTPGLLHAVNDNYFKRISAIEFTLNHDDGKNVIGLDECDVILVGISRTSKTPLSIYLSMEGLKVINIPLIKGMILPEELFKVDQRKVFALTKASHGIWNLPISRAKDLFLKNRNNELTLLR